MDIETLIEEKDAAKKLSISVSTLLRARRRGKLEFYRIGWRVFYEPSQLTKWIEQHCKLQRQKDKQ